MKHLKYTLFLVIVLTFTCCGSEHYIPVVQKETITIRDTTKIHTVDTLVQVPEFHLSDFVDVTDTLEMRTPLVTSRSWIDTTTNTLKGRVDQNGKLPVKVVERERVVYRDSILDREVPVPYEVEKPVRYTPWYARILAVIGALALLLASGWIALKFLLKR
jgi:hypothetical protein